MQEEIGIGDRNIFEKRHYVMYITVVRMGGDIISVQYERPLRHRAIKALHGAGLSSSGNPEMVRDVIDDG
jgi:hypothetical protein